MLYHLRYCRAPNRSLGSTAVGPAVAEIFLNHFMTTRTKLNIAIYTMSIMMLLNVFSKPLLIPEALQWVVIIGVFIPIGFMFYFIKKQKQEIQEQPDAVGTEAQVLSDRKRNTKRGLIYMMVLACLTCLSSPFIMPLTGNSLGTQGDLACGIIAAIIICTILGFRLRKL